MRVQSSQTLQALSISSFCTDSSRNVGKTLESEAVFMVEYSCFPPQPPQQQQEHAVVSPNLSSLSTLSTLWVPLDETIEQWATFAHEALTVPALLATGAAFHGLAWETKALRHYTWAVQERERGRLRKEAHWLGRAVQDLDCAIDQWYQVLSWLHLAGNDDQQPDPASLDTIRSLMGQVHEHQE